jgi:tRNA A-37 threonylcarbamoyl transferase component Bud32
MQDLTFSSPFLTDKTLLHAGRGLQPDVYRAQVNGKPAVLKDYSQRGWSGRLLGWLITRRERHAYRLLQNVQGVPALYGRFGAFGLMTEYVEGALANAFEPGELPQVFFERLSALVERLHAAGVAHGDLKRKKNIIVTADFEPYLIDFAASFTRGERWNFARNWLFEQMCRIDGNGVAKLKRRLSPEWLTEEERHNLTHPTVLERLARRLLGR